MMWQVSNKFSKFVFGYLKQEFSLIQVLSLSSSNNKFYFFLWLGIHLNTIDNAVLKPKKKMDMHMNQYLNPLKIQKSSEDWTANNMVSWMKLGNDEGILTFMTDMNVKCDLIDVQWRVYIQEERSYS